MTPEQLTAIIEDQIEAHREQLNTAADKGLYDGDTIKAICRNVVAATLHPPLVIDVLKAAALEFAEAYYTWNTKDTGEHVDDHLGDEGNDDVVCPACDADEVLMTARTAAYDRYLAARNGGG